MDPAQFLSLLIRLNLFDQLNRRSSETKSRKCKIVRGASSLDQEAYDYDVYEFEAFKEQGLTTS